ncbi:LuxR family transcriptional regulator [Allosaccharopolyspora coralli]|uniref:LuxR family transcriptional regulator n=1 Tax=Allosaccharopolyspora coralli TaxID=2665642 RepID=A0A5Q3QH10_9PSEU|nr:LuxR C-terminal-related transcriptional regulator [Allosaccharopolyspora coralli]QGK70815.1 LuxR family transcriptional regulator [Allosaccharopolyspora coralli]
MAPPAHASTREPAGNLPVDVTSFVGRRREITLTKRLLAESRVVTLTGSGGVGKTRLAIRVATNVRRNFRDKAWSVELEDVRDPSLLADAVREQLGLSTPESPTDVDGVVDQLRQSEMLLVLDNCEHLIDEAALFVDTVIRRCPGVRILATSRQSLGVAGESTMVVPPLQVPDPDHLPAPESYEQFASVRLFLDRARAVLPELEVDAQNGPALMRLCHHLDGNPLAIELAAVRLRSLSLEQLEERLAERYDLLTQGRRGAPSRQQTLQALVDWSWDLLTEGERRAWARISVFSGSFELEAAEHVAGNGLSPVAVLGAMHSLVDKSVLLREETEGEVRYRLLHILRDYGQERLAESGEQRAVRRKHYHWFAGLVNRFAREWIGSEQVAWLERLHNDHGNLRAAMDAALEDDDGVTTALLIAVQLTPYWTARGLNGEARMWLEKGLERSSTPSPQRSAAVRANAWFALLQGDVPAADKLLDQAASGPTGSVAQAAYLAQVRGMRAFFVGDLSTATTLLEDALSGFRTARAAQGELFALFGLGFVRGMTGESETGLVLLEQAIALSTDYDEVFWRAYALWASAHVEFERGNLEHAENAAKDALRLKRRLDNRLATAFSFGTLAWIAQRQRRPDRAARLFGASAAMWDAVRAAPAFYATFEAAHVQHEEETRTALGDDTFDQEFERGYRMTSAGALDFALEVKKRPKPAPTKETAGGDEVKLTRREREIAALVAQGRTNKEIAENLVIAQRTVEGHVQHILTKLDFSSRAQIAGWLAGQHTGGSGDQSP